MVCACIIKTGKSIKEKKSPWFVFKKKKTLGGSEVLILLERIRNLG